MNGCEEYELLLSAQLDGQLSAREASALEAHLASCPHCRALQAELALIQKEAELLTLEPPADLTAKIMAQVRLEPRVSTPLTASSSRRRWTRFLAGAAVLALIVAGASYGGLLSFGNKNTVPETISTQASDDQAPLPQEQNERQPEAAGETAPSPQERTGSVSSPPKSESKTVNEPGEAPSEGAPADQGDSQPAEAQLPASDITPYQRSAMSGSGYSGDSNDAEPALESATLTQEEAQARLVDYLAAGNISYSSLKYLGTCQGEEGYLFTINDQNDEAGTYWVSLEDGTVSPVSGLEKTPGE